MPRAVQLCCIVRLTVKLAFYATKTGLTHRGDPSHLLDSAGCEALGNGGPGAALFSDC